MMLNIQEYRSLIEFGFLRSMLPTYYLESRIDTSGAEPGRAFLESRIDTSGAEPGRAFDTFGNGPDRLYHGNMNNNNKRLPDIVNQENEFWSQPAHEAFYIPQPPSTLIPALPFTQTDEGLHDLPQDANWLFGDTGTFHFA